MTLATSDCCQMYLDLVQHTRCLVIFGDVVGLSIIVVFMDLYACRILHCLVSASGTVLLKGFNLFLFVFFTLGLAGGILSATFHTTFPLSSGLSFVSSKVSPSVCPHGILLCILFKYLY